MSLLTICPYTLKPVSQLSEKSREHIIPDAIGGPDGFSVYAEKSENGRLNNAIDAPFANDDFVRMLATQHGVKNRSGPVTWKIRGKTTIDGEEFDVNSEFGQSSVNTKMRKPIITDPETGKACGVIGWGEEVSVNFENFRKNLERKHGEGNVDIQITEHRINHNSSVKGIFD